MTLPAQKFREIVFLLLYGRDTGRSTDESMEELLSAELKVSKKNVKEAIERMRQIVPHLDAIDMAITKASHAYAFERIPTVEKNILRLGAYELEHDREVPPKVAIAEANRLARKFSTKESASFINAILNAIHSPATTESEVARTSQAMAQSEQAAQAASQQKTPKEPSSADE